MLVKFVFFVLVLLVFEVVFECEGDVLVVLEHLNIHVKRYSCK